MSLVNEKTNHRYNSIKNKSYFRLGFQCLLQKPILNIVTVLILIGSIFLFKVKEPFLALFTPPPILLDIFVISIYLLCTIIPTITLLAFVEALGKHTAKPIEENLPLIFGENKPYPVLISYKKNNNIICAEFYSDRTTINDWKNEEAFENAFRGRLISVKIGPKYKKRSSHFIVQYTDSLKQTNNGDLIDTPFPADSGV